jgi:hypothetical protein
LPGDARSPAAWLRRVPDHRQQIGQRRFLQCRLEAVEARHEDEAARLIAHELLQRGALLRCELAFLHTDIAEENHVELRQLLVLRERLSR